MTRPGPYLCTYASAWGRTSARWVSSSPKRAFESIQHTTCQVPREEAPEEGTLLGEETEGTNTPMGERRRMSGVLEAPRWRNESSVKKGMFSDCRV